MEILCPGFTRDGPAIANSPNPSLASSRPRLERSVCHCPGRRATLRCLHKLTHRWTHTPQRSVWRERPQLKVPVTRIDIFDPVHSTLRDLVSGADIRRISINGHDCPYRGGG